MKKKGSSFFEKMQIFYNICTEQSFSKAAIRMGVDQSTISRNLQSFEKRLGYKLIKTSQKPIILTEKGRDLYEVCKLISFEMTHIEKIGLGPRHNFIFNKFRLFVAVPIVLGFIFARRAGQFFKDYPEILLDISFVSKSSFDMLNYKDFIVADKNFQHIFADTFFLGSYEFVFVASRNYLKRRGVPRDITDLKYHDFVHAEYFEYEDLMIHDWEVDIMNNLERKYLFENELGAVKAAELGIGIALIPTYALPDLVDMVVILKHQKMKKINYYILRSKLRDTCHIDLSMRFFQEAFIL